MQSYPKLSHQKHANLLLPSMHWKKKKKKAKCNSSKWFSEATFMIWQERLSKLLPKEQLCFPLQFRATPLSPLEPCIFPYPVKRRHGAQADSTFISLHLLFMLSTLQCSRGQINHAQACKKKKEKEKEGWGVVRGWVLQHNDWSRLCFKMRCSF